MGVRVCVYVTHGGISTVAVIPFFPEVSSQAPYSLSHSEVEGMGAPWGCRKGQASGKPEFTVIVPNREQSRP